MPLELEVSAENCLALNQDRTHVTTLLTAESRISPQRAKNPPEEELSAVLGCVRYEMTGTVGESGIGGSISDVSSRNASSESKSPVWLPEDAVVVKVAEPLRRSFGPTMRTRHTPGETVGDHGTKLAAFENALSLGGEGVAKALRGDRGSGSTPRP
jgi:hypothetical protein